MRRLALLALLMTACAPALTNYQLGAEALEGGDAEAAEAHWQKALDDPADAEQAKAALVDIWMSRAKEFESYAAHRSLTEYEKVLELEPGSIDARLGAAHILDEQGRSHEAVQVLTDPACEGCGEELGNVFEHRAKKALAEQRYEDAAKDLGQALKMNPSAAVYIDLAELATAGHIGAMSGAVDHMARAHPLLGTDTELQQRWWTVRTAVAVGAAEAQQWDALDQLMLWPDPRQGLDPTAQRDEIWETTLTVAAAEQHAGHTLEGVARGKPVLDAAEAQMEPTNPALIGWRRKVMKLYERHITHLLDRGDSETAIRTLGYAMAKSEDVVLEYQMVFATALESPSKAQAMLEKIPEAEHGWDRVDAILRLVRARNSLVAGNLQGAKNIVSEVAAEYPDMLDVHLVRAEILTASPVPHTNNTSRRAFEGIGTYSYPKGRINRYGEALAEVLWTRHHYEEPVAQADPLRIPGFGNELEELEKGIRAFYPFDVRAIPGEAPRVILTNAKEAPVKVTVVGPGVNEEVVVEPGKQHTSVFDRPGLVRVSPGEKVIGLFGEQKTAVVIAL